MSLNCRFAIASDLHIGLPHTIWNHPSRFHLIEVSIPAFEQVLNHVSQLDIDFLLLPGDLVQHGERENHEWLRDRLLQLPFPVYVIPGNHDFIVPQGDDIRIAPEEFPEIYQKFGYGEARSDLDPLNSGQFNSGQFNSSNLDYSVSPLPGLRLIGLNSNQFDKQGHPIGRLTQQQFTWLRQELERIHHLNLSKLDLSKQGLEPGLAQERSQEPEQVLIMIHHNVIEHLPNQTKHPLGHKYMLRNASRLRSLLKEFGVQLIFTGHLHVQDVARDGDLHEITTGSMVSYPHPYRVLQFQVNQGQAQLSYESFRVAEAGEIADLQGFSRQWMGDRSGRFMENLLTTPPINLPQERAVQLAPSLRNFWADIAGGDGQFNFAQLPEQVRGHFQAFGATDGAIDNGGRLTWPVAPAR